jgi:hypothetical protein
MPEEQHDGKRKLSQDDLRTMDFLKSIHDERPHCEVPKCQNVAMKREIPGIGSVCSEHYAKFTGKIPESTYRCEMCGRNVVVGANCSHHA